VYAPTFDRVAVAGAVTAYLRRRFPLPLMAVTALLGAAAVLPHRTGPLPVLLLAAAGPTLLFLAQRLVDDIDDFDGDRVSGAVPASVTRRGMTTGYVVLVLGVVAVSLRDPVALGIGAGAMAAMWAGPLAARGPLERVKPLLFLLYEGVPFAIVLYPAVRSGASENGGWGGPVAVAVVLWCGYEFWKFTRKAGDRAYAPFGLGPAARLWAGSALAATATAVALVAGRSATVPWTVAGAATAVSALFAVLSARCAARGAAQDAAPWAGLPILVVLPAAVVASALLAT
jgi:hypothetical protein